MRTRIQKWGNSLAVRIPKSFAAGLGLMENAPVEMTLEDEALVIKPDREGTWDLDSLLGGVTDEKTLIREINARPASPATADTAIRSRWACCVPNDGMT